MTRQTSAAATGSNVPMSIAYGSAVKPWHGFGEEIQPGETVFDTMARAGMDFEVAVSPISYGYDRVDGENQRDLFARIEADQVQPKYFTADRRALYRVDDGHIFDTPRSGYHPVQNRDIVQLFDEYVKAGDMRIETMGTFEHGRKCWLLADMDMGFDAEGDGKKAKGKDPVLGKVLFYIPHIYGEGCSHKTTSVSVVCSNTLDAARKEKSKVYRLWHNVEWNEARAAQAALNLEECRKEFLQLKADAQMLSKIKLSLAEASVITVSVIGTPGARLADQNRNFVKVMDLYQGGQPGALLPSREGTAWGLLNAVTYYEDWAYGTKKTAQDARLERAWYGQGSRAKVDMRDRLVRFAEGKLELGDMLDAAVAELEAKTAATPTAV